MRKKNKLMIIAISVIIAIGFVFAGCPDPEGGNPAIYIATANGSASTTTTQIILNFSADPVGLMIADISLGGSVTKGSAILSGNGTSRTISGFTVNSSGNATITITRSGIESVQKNVPVFLAGSSLTTYTATANGSASTTTTQITLNFSADPADLTIADIALGGSVTKGSATLSGNGTSRTISGFTVNSSGNATITITRSGIESVQKIVPVFLVSSGPRTIVVDMYDSASDGWDHNGALRVNINGTNQTVRLNSGGFGSQTLTVNPGDEVNVYWTGDSGSYHNENAFIFYWEDSPPSPAFNATDWSGSNALLFRLRSSLSNANINQLLGSFTITASGGVEILTTYTATATTTQIILNFSADPVGLTIADITLGGSITKGSAMLSGSGTTRTISGFTMNSNGNATIAITRNGIESGQKIVLILSVPEMVLIPSGNFQRGSSTVTLTGFNMSKYQVTQEQYQAVMGSNPSYFSSSPATGEVQGRRPVERVSWYDAIVFCNRLSILEGLSPAYSINGSTNPEVWGAVPTSSNSTWNAVTIVSGSTGYRLPTEAQWEYACRAGTTTDYYWGNQTDAATVGQYAWYWNNSNSRTHEVGKKLPNNFGLYDMSGNVWEWCWDWYASYPSGDQTDPVGASSGSYRVVRGGGWNYYVIDLQSALRNDNDPYNRGNYLGFRVLRPSL